MTFLSRTRDIVGALLGLLFLSPFLGLIARLIKRDSPGPVFYKGPRAAKGGGTFQILKFRTMYENPESYNGSKITSEDDPRITPVGQWLRNTKLNELPQLWNVLKGEMSLVGPRPEDPGIVAEWPEDIKSEILSVRPGITSPASVLYRDEEGMLKNSQVMETYLSLIQPSKIRLDQLYVRHRSFWLDLDVILWTALILLPLLGSYNPPERLLFAGPLSIFRHRFINWFTIDLITVFISFGIAGLFWRSLGPIHIGWSTAILVSLGFALVFSVIGGIIGVQRIHWSRASAADIFELMISSIVASLIALLLNRVFSIMPSQIIVIAAVVAFLSFVVVRYRTRLFSGIASRVLQRRKTAQSLRERVLIIGCGDAGLFAVWLLENSRAASKYCVLGFIDDDIYKHKIRVRGVKVLGGRDDIPHLVEEHDIGIIIFAIHNISSIEKKKVVDICKSTSAKIVIFPNVLAELELAVVRIGDLEHSKSTGTYATGKVININSDISSSQMEKWLNELRKDIEGGKIEKGIIRIKELQERLKI